MQLPSRVESLSEQGICEPGGMMDCYCSHAQGGLGVQLANIIMAEVKGLKSQHLLTHVKYTFSS